MTKKLIRIGTRMSPLAMYQAEITKALIKHHHPEIEVEIHGIKTTGDTVLNKRLSDIGGKGLFTKELDRALDERQCDIAVHSLKDVETILPAGMELIGYLPRARVEDVVISRDNIPLWDLPKGAVVGTVSLRRQAQVLHHRPDLQIKMIRGNVGTRLEKMRQGKYDAIILAYAGVERLGLTDIITEILDPLDFYPAVGQGIIVVQACTSQPWLREIVSPFNCLMTEIKATCERGILLGVDGTCKTPVGVHTVIDRYGITMRAFLSTMDGVHTTHLVKSVPIEEGEETAVKMGKELRTIMEQHDGIWEH